MTTQERMHKTQIRLIQLVYQSRLLTEKRRGKTGRNYENQTKETIPLR